MRRERRGRDTGPQGARTVVTSGELRGLPCQQRSLFSGKRLSRRRLVYITSLPAASHFPPVFPSLLYAQNCDHLTPQKRSRAAEHNITPHTTTAKMKSSFTGATAAFVALAAAVPQGPPQGAPSQASSYYQSWASANGLPTATSAWSSLSSDWASWTSAASVTSWPTASSEWASLTSAHPVPSDLSSWASNWATVTTRPGWWGGAWGPNGNGNGNGVGWNPSFGHGPFGNGGDQNGWGPWAAESSGAWTSGPWTSWWGTGGCPPSSWPGK
jgi:hypothetical protein